MFDIGWTEMLVIAVVAIVVVGPKDLPQLLRTVGGFVTKARRMAGDFQKQVNEVMRETELAEVQKEVAQIGKLDPLKDVRKSFEPITRAGEELTRDLSQAGAPAAKAAAPAVAAAAAPATAALAETAPAAVAEAVEPAAAVAAAGMTASATTSAVPAGAAPVPVVAAPEPERTTTDWDMLSEQERALIQYNEVDITLGAPIVYAARDPEPEPEPLPEVETDSSEEPAADEVHPDPEAPGEVDVAREDDETAIAVERRAVGARAS